jgi:hypothetical protein
MSICSYFCHIVGEDPARVARFHSSTIKRMKAFAIAIHIPVLLWAMTGYLIASQIFKLTDVAAAGIAFLCSGLIYLVERLVLATPKVWFVNFGRVVIGVVIAVLGASTVDLVIFDREVRQQLLDSGEERIRMAGDKTAAEQALIVAQKKTDWLKIQEAANCEANGTCGSKIRSVGPVYRELSRQAALARIEYVTAEAKLTELAIQKQNVIAQWRSAPQVVEEAGLLARVEALHQYTQQNTAALVAWGLFFLLVLFLELMVVLAKLVFGETVDDELDQIRERISQQKARSYLEAISSPVNDAKHLLEATYG